MFFLCFSLVNKVPVQIWSRSDNTNQVNDANLVVSDSSGKTIEAQYVIMDNVTSNLRKFYQKAYLGLSSNQVPQYWLVFPVSVPPLGWSTYFIANAPAIGKKKRQFYHLLREHMLILFPVWLLKWCRKKEKWALCNRKSTQWDCWNWTWKFENVIFFYHWPTQTNAQFKNWGKLLYFSSCFFMAAFLG